VLVVGWATGSVWPVKCPATTNWSCWDSRYGKRQHQYILAGKSGHTPALGHCDHRPFRFSMCPSLRLTLANLLLLSRVGARQMTLVSLSQQYQSTETAGC